MTDNWHAVANVVTEVSVMRELTVYTERNVWSNQENLYVDQMLDEAYDCGAALYRMHFLYNILSFGFG